MKTLRCLIAGPTPGMDGESGDVQYVRDLLIDPPENVTYVTYGDAFASGEVREGPSLRPGRPAPRTLGSLGLALPRAVLHGARRTGILLPDPVRWWHIDGDFDLVHAHCFPLRLSGNIPPVVVTDSTGTFWHWTATIGYRDRTVWRKLRRERRVAKALGYMHPTARPDAAAAAMYFAESGCALAGKIGIDPNSIRIAPPGVPLPLRTSELALSPPTLLFVAHDFELKGGPHALKAFEHIRKAIPNCRLVVAGSGLPDPEIEGVDWIGPVGRHELYRDIYPTADLFLYPSRADTYGLVIAEALAHGVPAIAPRKFAIPDIIRENVTGILIDSYSPESFAQAAIGLLNNPSQLRSLSEAAIDDFQKRLSPRVRNRILGQAYRDAVARR